MSILESEVSQLYDMLASKVEQPLIKSLLLYIAVDSKKHAVTLKTVSESIAKSEVALHECEKMLGEIWHVSSDFHKEISAIKRISEEELTEFAERLTMLEGLFGEEYHMFVQLKTLTLISKEISQLYNVNIEQLKSVFSLIIEDEEHHREILGKIKEAIRKM
ncbi:MAG: hypothetical protein QXU99_07320 [Candidatus Bathyarchaeia archaeon]